MAIPITFRVSPVAYEQTDSQWLGKMKPYAYQRRVYQLVQEALAGNETLCLFLVTPTGSGKTLGSYAYAIKHQVPAIGVYPTNELIRDQEGALKQWIDPGDDCRLLRIDSAQLDHWQDALGEKQHATAFETLMNWHPTILTNPDILFYTFFGLYAGPPGLGQRLWTLMGEYQLFVFDEFHLYNVKQMADVTFLAGALYGVNPHKGRVFIFASATPESPALTWLQHKLGLRVEVVEGQASEMPGAHRIAHPLELTLLPADLDRWQGTEVFLEYLPQLQQFVACYPQARMVMILDSVAGAINVAQVLRSTFPNRPVGEVHGFSSDEERAAATQQPITVGTSTIEVGIDFQNKTEKDVLIYEARTASQFIQRFGRLARHPKSLPIPNQVIALVPDYVYHHFAQSVADENCLSRAELYTTVSDAYQAPQDFSHYLRTHAVAEFHAARLFIESMFQPDDRPRVASELETTIEALTGKSAGQAASKYRRYTEEGILQPLLTFRGSGFEAAILDDRGSDQGFPARRYNLLFLLRRGVFSELDQPTYLLRLDDLAARWPEQAARESRYGKRIGRKAEDLLGVYGYVVLKALLDKGRKVWFEVNEEEVMGHKAQVTTITGLELATEPEVSLRHLNKHMRRKHVVAWFIDQHPTSIKLGRALPPLFSIYDLRIRRIGGQLGESPWAIAFNQDAFFLDSLGWYKQQREDSAIFL
jgi:CRISPR-associated endonuclease/helicase Cas3